MAEQELGEAFAIHGGGSDLVFPHHENEIAQSEAAGRPFARLWMHNGMVETGTEKMSKSEGNIFQLSEALARYGRDAVIDYLLSGHYRQPLSFGPEEMEQARSRVERIRNYFRAFPPGEEPVGEEDPFVTARREDFEAALADDFNTPRAMAEAAFDLVNEGYKRQPAGAPEALREMLAIFGLDNLAEPDAAPDDEAEALLAEREGARAARDFERADAIRAELAERGWEVRDSAEGATLVPLAARG
jgi:cysteinyl-tRNA synthetase